MPTPQEIEAQLQSLKSAGIVPGAPAQGSPLPPQVMQYAQDMLNAPPPQPKVIGSHETPDIPLTRTGPAPFHAKEFLAGAHDIAPAQAAEPAPMPTVQPQAAPVPMPKYIPPHFDNSRIPYRPETQRALLGAYDHMAQAEDNVAKAEQDKSTIVANAIDSHAEAAKTSMAARAQREDARQQAMQQQIDKYQNAVDAVSQGQINPNQVWENKSTFGKAVAILGAMAGGAQAGLHGGPNTFAQMYQQEGQNNLNAQEGNLAAKQ